MKLERIEELQNKVGLDPEEACDVLERLAYLEEGYKRTYCAFCGEEFIADTPDTPNTLTCIQAHVAVCPKHPMREVEARTEYLTSCPSCDAGPMEDTGFPNMDEDGCCVACGMDCSIAGLVDAFKQSEEAVRVFRHALVQIKNHTEDPASEITASIALSDQP